MKKIKNSMDIVPKALEFATKYHKNMVRKGTRIPYMAHLLNVAKLLAERNCSDEIIAAAILHDIVEDCAVTIEEISTKFGKDIAEIVAGATEKYKLEKSDFDAVATWQERKQHTIDTIKERATLEQVLVIMADKLDNISSISYDLKRIGNDVWDRFNANKEQQKWYYENLLLAFQSRLFNNVVYPDLLNEFRIKVNEVFNESQ